MIFIKAPKVIKALKDLNDFGGRRPTTKAKPQPPKRVAALLLC